MKILSLDILLVLLGGAILAYAVQRRASPIARSVEGVVSVRTATPASLFVSVFLLSAPFLIYGVLRMQYVHPIDLNEGWNVFHATRFGQGGQLYLPLRDLPLTPLVYPPLSFVLIGALGGLTGNVLMTGRIVALFSLVVIGYLLYSTARSLGLNRAVAALSMAFWFALMAQQARQYVGMYDPEMLGRVFSLGALCLYAKWRAELTPKKTRLVAGLVILGISIKHLLVVVPATLAIVMFVENRQALRTFVLTALAMGAVLVGGAWAYAGEKFFANFVELDRPQSASRMVESILHWFPKGSLVALLLPIVVLLIIRPRRHWPVLVYAGLSLVVGSLAARGSGVDINSWFDFFFAAALTVGLLCRHLYHMRSRWSVIVSLIIFATLWPLSARTEANLDRLLSYRDLRHQELAFRSDVDYLRSIPGPAVFQERLLGYFAGKRFLFDTTAGAWLIASGRVPREVVLSPIRQGHFSVVVLNSDLSDPRVIRSEWMQVVRDRYVRADPGHQSRYFFYIPNRRRSDPTD